MEEIAELVQSAASLRTQLRNYELTMTEIGERLDQGWPAIEASIGTPIPGQRSQVTAAIREFECTRHQLRLALFTLGRAEGASISDVGRILGISRQLASRLAAEAAAKELTIRSGL